MDHQLLHKAQAHVERLLTDNLADYCTYHNVQHTMDVYESACRIGALAQIDKPHQEYLSLAALFHDTGYIDGAADHELRSAEHAGDWLRSEGYPSDDIEIIQQLILVTEVSCKPDNELECMMRDADMYHLASDDYMSVADKLRAEMTIVGGGAMTDREWLQRNIDFFEQHHYLSTPGKILFDAGKKLNLQILEAAMARLDTKKKKVQTLSSNKAASMQFKTALRNHIDLSTIADNKANMMLSVNALILTISIPAIGIQLADRPRLVIPFGLLILTCILSIIYATLATKPIKMYGLTTREDVTSGSANLFFFGNFFNMRRADYQQGIREVIQDKDHLESAIIRDLFDLGRALGGKYRYLRICYNIFMFGLISTTAAFVGVLVSYALL